jgi:hypothetical protein
LKHKWIQIFKLHKEKDVDISNLVAVVEFTFCLPGSNASIERMFSFVISSWTDIRNQMDMGTVQSCLITKTNGLSCMEFHDDILKITHFRRTYTVLKII